MNNVAKGMLIILIILYIASPADLAIGPVDDVIAGLIGFAAMKTSNKD